MLGDANTVLDVLLPVLTMQLTGYTAIIWDCLDVRDTISTNMGVTRFPQTQGTRNSVDY